MNMNNELVKDICGVLSERVSEGFNVSYEYVNHIMVTRADDDIELFIGDLNGDIEWNTQYGVCGDVIDRNLPIDVIVDRLIKDVDSAGIFHPIMLGRGE